MSTNFDLESKIESVLGETYPYYANIKSPDKIGMSDKGSLQQMGKNISGLIEYVSLLVSGKSKASATGNPLGNKFFLKVAGKCKAIDKCSDPSDYSTCEEVNRYIYVDNVPEGNIPFISYGLDTNFSEFRGLIPGTMSNLNVLNPASLLRSFTTGPSPPCQQITMETINSDNIKSNETNYVALIDIQSIDPCSFKSIKGRPDIKKGYNPVSQKSSNCDAFTNLKSSLNDFNNSITNNNYELYDYDVNFPDDIKSQVYFSSLSLLGLIIFYNLMKKS